MNFLSLMVLEGVGYHAIKKAAMCEQASHVVGLIANYVFEFCHGTLNEHAQYVYLSGKINSHRAGKPASMPSKSI